MPHISLSPLLVAFLAGGCLVAPAPDPTVPPPSAPPPSAVAPGGSPAASPTDAPRPTGRIVFRSDVDPVEETTDIFVVDADGSNLVRLTNDAWSEGYVYWQADGSRLLFVWDGPPREGPPKQSLASIRPDGSDRRELGPVTTWYHDPVLSPDGRYVAFGSDGNPAGDAGITLLDLVAGERIQLTRDGATSPIWSPDGSMILAGLAGGIGVVDVATGFYVATVRVEGARLVGWTPDGRSILFIGCRGWMTKPQCLAAPIIVAGADGSNPRLYDGPEPAAPDGTIVSPDGSWAASILDGRLYVAPVGGPRQRLAASLSHVSGPAWSPDSAWLAVTGSGVADSGTRIYVVSRLGGEPIPVTAGPSDFGPIWKPAEGS